MKPAAGGPPREVRLVGGSLKRSKLPVADRPGLRPTPDRVRETLFNWLGQDLTGWQVLDAFAGSGALGFEAASRGAAEVLLLERDPALARSLQASQARLQATTLRVEAADAIAWMARCAAGPLRPGAARPTVRRRPAGAGAGCRGRRCWWPGGLLYLESPAALPPAEIPREFALSRQGRAGAVHYHLLRRNT